MDAMAEEKTSPLAPWWSLNQETIAKLARQKPYRHVGTVIYRLKKKYGEKKDQE